MSNEYASVKELVDRHGLISIERLEKEILDDFLNSIAIRENWQYVSHAKIFPDGNMLILVPTKSWSDGDGNPLYVFHFHCLYERNSKTGKWERKTSFYPKEFRPDS